MPGSHLAAVLEPAFILREACWGYWPSLLLALLWLPAAAVASLRLRTGGRPVFRESIPVAVWSLQAIGSLHQLFEGHAHGSREWLTFAWVEVLALACSGILLLALLLAGAAALRRLGVRSTGQGIVALAPVTVALNALLMLATLTAIHLLAPTESPYLR